jgi:hypothetical protein
MENENLVDSSDNASSVSSDKVDYASFKKSVDAEKRARQRATELEAQLENLKTKELEEKQEFKALADEYKTKLQQAQEELRRKDEQYGWEKVTSAIKSKAKDSGCVAPDKLIRLFDKSDFELLRAEDGQIKSDTLEALMDKAKKENSFLFNQGQVKFNDALPGNKGQEKVDVSSLSKKEIEELLLKSY